MVVSDLDDIFVPLPDDLLVNLSESRSVVETFLDSLPSMFQDNVNLESAFGPALKAAFMVMVCNFFQPALFWTSTCCKKLSFFFFFPSLSLSLSIFLKDNLYLSTEKFPDSLNFRKFFIQSLGVNLVFFLFYAEPTWG